MYQTMEIYMARKRKVPQRFVPNTYRVFDENVTDFNLAEVKITHHPVPKKTEKFLQRSRSPGRNNMPHPFYARFLSDSVKYLSEPICHVETADTIHKQMEWWPNGEQPVSRHKPLYDRLTTQRSDYQSLVFCNHPTRHGSNPHMYPMCGIGSWVDLKKRFSALERWRTFDLEDQLSAFHSLLPKAEHAYPKLLQEEISYIHKYDSRLTPNEPIRGKRHGAFVWREIKTDSGPVVPQGTKRFLNATGSHSLEQPQTGKGNSVESSMTSPKLCVHSSQQMFNSESHLSKTDLREAAKTYARNTAREQSSPGGSQTAKSQSLVPIGELVSSRPTEKPL